MSSYLFNSQCLESDAVSLNITSPSEHLVTHGTSEPDQTPNYKARGFHEHDQSVVERFCQYLCTLQYALL